MIRETTHPIADCNQELGGCAMSYIVMRLITSTLLVFALAASAALYGQDPPPSPEPPAAAGAKPAPGADASPRSSGVPEPKPFDKVITKEFSTDEGLFKVYRNRDKVYYEIPTAELNKEFLWVSQIRSTTLGAGYGGQALGHMVVRWELRDRRVLLRSVDYDVVADPASPIARAVRDANEDTIIMAFNVESFHDGAPVIDISKLFTTDVPEISARVRLKAKAMDTARSYIDRVASYPDQHRSGRHTYLHDAHRSRRPPDRRPRRPTPFSVAMRPGSGTVVVHFSMVKLPEKPMMPRLFDERVGYFTISHDDYGRRAASRRERTLHHALSPREEGSERGALRAGQADRLLRRSGDADEVGAVHEARHRGLAAGVRERRASRTRSSRKEAPTKAEDPDWSPEDARYSVIRWLPSTTENAVRAARHDPRTGEILECGHSVLPQRAEPGDATGTSCRSARSIRARRSCRCPTI